MQTRARVGRRRWSAVVAVVAAAAVLAACGGGGTPSGVKAPSERMSGQVSVAAAAFPTAQHAVILIQQKLPSTQPSGARQAPSFSSFQAWTAITNDGGHHWTVRPTTLPVEAGVDLDFPDASNGWLAGAWVTHDGGTTWTRVRDPSQLAVASLSIAGGRVWGTAEDAQGRIIVLAGAVTGDSLAAVAGHQRADGPVVAASATRAYVAGDAPPLDTATTTGGTKWRDVSTPCPTGHAVPVSAPGVHGADLLQACEASRSVNGTVEAEPSLDSYLLARSTDGGTTWSTVKDPETVTHPQLVSATVAWGICGAAGAQVCRSTTAGSSFSAVWPPAHAKVGTLQQLIATSPLVATAVASVTSGSGTYLIDYRTANGGHTWTPTEVPLP